jgi:hypothetical protein
MSWVFEESETLGNHRLVLLAIADCYGDRGAWPSIATLAHHARVTERTVHRAIKRAAVLGELAVAYKAGPHGTNLYTLTKWQGQTLTPVTTDPVIAVSRDPDIAMTPERKNQTEQQTPEFDQFWNIYPRKVSKGSARKAWDQALKRGVEAETIIEAAGIYASSVKGSEARFIAHPATWLNADRWEDEESSVLSPEPTFVAPELNEDDYSGFIAEVEQRRWSTRGGDAARASDR